MWEPEHNEMAAASKTFPHVEAASWGFSARRTSRFEGEAEVPREETGRCTEGARRGMGPGACTQFMEITSGRTICQQGLAATCKDLVEEATSGASRRHLVRRMSR